MADVDSLVPLTIEGRLALQDFLIAEADLLDTQQFEPWLELFTDDVEYTAPIRVTRKNPGPSVVEDISYFDETKQSLGLRVRRLGTDVAWAEDPPSLTRRFVTNFRFEPSGSEVVVRTNLLLYRSRGDRGAHDLICGERQDTVRVVDGALRIARRRIVLDQASLSTKNLGVFL